MRRFSVLVAAIIIFTLGWNSRAAEPNAVPTAAQTGPLTILNDSSAWRLFHLLKPPVIQMDDGPKPVLAPAEFGWINQGTPAAPASWMKPAFDDSSWLRGSDQAYAHSPYLARLYLRTHFQVSDPAQVKDLKLTLGYYGGAIVYLNGQELSRGNVAKAAAMELADAYPADVFVSLEGKILPADGTSKRLRSLTDVAIPAALLQKGVNTLAIEIIRAPYDKVLEEQKGKAQLDSVKGGSPYAMTWNTCQLERVMLVTASGTGLSANTGRTKEWQAWNGDILVQDQNSDVADQAVPLLPITIKGARNGWYSGKMVVASSQPIAGLRASLSGLKQGSATIPASAARVRYGTTWEGGPSALEALLESPLEVFPAGKNGTVVPLWVTVKIPANAKPGTYTGQMSISAKDQLPITAAIKLDVADWTVPNQDDWKAWVELIQSPDSLALEYDAPLWSDKHWALMQQSMHYMGELGSRTLYVPLIAHTNFGNAESMVRWIKKPDGSYDWDFSIMDKYLDLAQKNLGPKLKFVAFNVWEVYLFTGSGAVVVSDADKKDPYLLVHAEAKAKRWELRDKGPAVTGLDPATGKTETINLPRFEDPAAKPIWKALFVELRQRMAARGLKGAMALAMVSDIWPTKEENAAIADATGNLPWVNHTHGGGYRYSLAPVKYTAFVWNNVYGPDPSKERMYGWKRPELATEYLRFDYLNRWPLSSILRIEEFEITGQQRGLGRIGADFWPVLKDKRGVRRGYVADRYPESFWHSLNMGCALLVPGPTGPVASSRYEVFREGVQECEARIALELVLTDPTLKAKLSPELAQKAQDVLDERVRETFRIGSQLGLPDKYDGVAGLPIFHGTYAGGTVGHIWFASSGWQQRAGEFYDLAGEVVKKASAK